MAREARRDTVGSDIVAFLKARFGPEAEGLESELRTLSIARLKKPIGSAAVCPDLASFRAQIAVPKRNAEAVTTRPERSPARSASY